MQVVKKGDVQAMYEVGQRLYSVKGVDENLEKALQNTKKAADGGNVDAIFQMGEWYYLGEEGLFEKNKE